jgi:hypothetical protein
MRSRGVPQGVPTSPLLSTLALKPVLLESPWLILKGINVCQFADDGILYGNRLTRREVTVEDQMYLLDEPYDRKVLVDRYGFRLSAGQYALRDLSEIRLDPIFEQSLMSDRTGIEVN